MMEKKRNGSDSMSYSDIPVTTSVFIGKLPFTVNIPTAFALLPASHDVGLATLVHGRVTRNSAAKVRVKYILPDVPGTIMIVKCGDLSRGLSAENMLNGFNAASVDANENYSFPHCISMKMSVTDKFIDIKISPSSVHFSGVKTKSQSDEAYALIIKMMQTIQDDLDDFYGGGAEKLSALKRIAARIERSEHENEISTWLTGNEVRLIHSGGGGPPPSTVMINKNYTLGGPVSPEETARKIRASGKLHASYNNCVSNDAFAWIYDDEIDGYARGDFEKRDVVHRFIINASGQVTQSGRSLERMEISYNMLREALGEDIIPTKN